MREACAQALARLGADAIPALIAALAHGDWGVRQVAARELGRQGPEAKLALPSLRKLAKAPFFGLFQHPYRRLVREQAEYAIRALEDDADQPLREEG